MTVYMLMDKDRGVVKIGYTGNDISYRKASVEKVYGKRLDLIRLIVGGMALERAYHRRFHEFLIQSEWFTFCPDMLTETIIFPPHVPRPEVTTPIHPLRRWLFYQGITASEFSKRAGIAKGYLSEIMRGKKRPTLGMIDKISAATRRALSANDFQSPTESTNNDRAP